MVWNYRIIKRVFKINDEINENHYAIYEVYYSEDGGIKAWSKDPMYVCGETLKELKEDLKLYSSAFDKPVLDWNELEKNLEK